MVVTTATDAEATATAPSPGSVVEIAVTFLDSGQLARMHETELSTQNYIFGRLTGLAVKPEGLARLDAVHSYWSRHGFFTGAAGPIALSAIAAQGRRFAAASQETMQGHARDRLALERELHEFVTENAADPMLRRERGLALRADAQPFNHPRCEMPRG